MVCWQRQRSEGISFRKSGGRKSIFFRNCGRPTTSLSVGIIGRKKKYTRIGGRKLFAFCNGGRWKASSFRNGGAQKPFGSCNDGSFNGLEAEILSAAATAEALTDRNPKAVWQPQRQAQTWSEVEILLPSTTAGLESLPAAATAETKMTKPFDSNTHQCIRVGHFRMVFAESWCRMLVTSKEMNSLGIW